MISDPQSFFRFAAQHYGLLSDLFRNGEGLSDRELLLLIDRNAVPEDPENEHVMNRLVDFAIIEPVPGETARWEMTHPVRSLFRFLLHEQRLTSVAVIQGYLDDLGSCRDAFEKSNQMGDRSGAVQSLREMAEVVERLRQDVSDNQMAILDISMKTKANREHLTASERYSTINHVWEKYMDPMRDLIDVKKSMEALLDGLDKLLYSGVLRFARHAEVTREIAGSRARLLRMRRSVAEDFHESLREIEPLYQSLKEESQYARGTSIALARIEKEGLRKLGLDRVLGLPVWRTEGLLSDTTLETVLLGLQGYESGALPVVTRIEVVGLSAFVDYETKLQELSDDLPIMDLLAWLEGNCPDYSLSDILRLYGTIYCTPPGRVEFSQSRRDYQIRGTKVTALPMALLEEEIS